MAFNWFLLSIHFDVSGMSLKRHVHYALKALWTKTEHFMCPVVLEEGLLFDDRILFFYASVYEIFKAS